MNFSTGSFERLRYLTAVPDGFDVTRRYPCIIFLHGAGTRGDDLGLLRDNCYFERLAEHRADAVSFAPQCNADSWCDVHEQLCRFAEYVSALPFVDGTRVYLMGASMGGYETWQLAISRPELFAAIVPICGGGAYWNAARLASVPVWAVHGEDDSCVFFEESEKMVNAVNAAGGTARLERLFGVGHAAWEYAYASREIFDWMLSQRKASDIRVEGADMHDSAKYG